MKNENFLSENIAFRIDPETKQQIKVLAKIKNCSMALLIRELIRQEVKMSIYLKSDQK